jgi:nucleoid DNA-binding protein
MAKSSKNVFTRQDIIKGFYDSETAKTLNITLMETKAVVEELLQLITRNVTDLKEGERLELRGLGSFMAITRKPRTARNPKTGEAVKVPAKRALKFKPSPAVKGTKKEVVAPAPAKKAAKKK